MVKGLQFPTFRDSFIQSQWEKQEIRSRSCCFFVHSLSIPLSDSISPLQTAHICAPQGLPMALSSICLRYPPLPCSICIPAYDPEPLLTEPHHLIHQPGTLPTYRLMWFLASCGQWQLELRDCHCCMIHSCDIFATAITYNGNFTPIVIVTQGL